MLENRKQEFQGIRFDLPSEWHLLDRPDKPAPDFQFRVWRTQRGEEFCIAHWSGRPRTDGGAMVIAHQWKIAVAGQKTNLLETSFFQGQKRKVLVVFLTKDKGSYRIYTEGISHSRFRAILSTMSFVN